MGILSDAWKSLRKLSNFLGLGIPNRIHDWLRPDLPKARGLEIQRQGSNQNIPIVYGKRLVGAVIVNRWVSNTVTGLSGIKVENRNNAYLHYIVAFSHGEIDGYEAFYFDGELSTSSQFTNKFYIATTNGDATGLALPSAVANIPNFTANAIGKHVAYAHIVFHQDKDQKNWRGEPEVQALIRGIKVYDPRTDTTAHSYNNAICSLDLLTNNIYGRGLALTDTEVQPYIDAADFCDESTSSTITRTYPTFPDGPRRPPTLVTVVDVVETPRYKLNAILDTAETVFDNYKILLQSFRAFPRRPNGKPAVGFEDVGTPIMTFDSANGEIFGDIGFKMSGQRNRYNQFTVIFPNELNRYERDEVTYPATDSTEYTDWLAEDNDKELKGELELNTLSDKSSALQTAEIACKRSRIGGGLSATLNARARFLEPGDIIGISDESFGWTNKALRVASIKGTDENTFNVDMNEHENAVYPWSGSEWDEIEGGTWLGNPYDPESPENLVLTPDSTLALTGTLTWDAVDDNFIREYEIVVERFDDPDWVQVSSERTRGNSHPIQILSIGDYRANVYAVTTLGIRSEAGVLAFTLIIPAPPSSINLTASDWNINSKPFLSSAGLGTQFEFDYVEGDGAGHSPTTRATGANYTISGLIPGTLHTVFVRSVNAFGVSAWVNDSIETTVTGEQVSPFLDLIQAELDEAQATIDGLSNEVDLANISNIANIAEAFTEVYRDFERVEDLSTETQQRKQVFNELSAELDTVNGELNSTITRVDQVEIDADGNASAIAALELNVNNPTSGLAATVTRVDQVEIDADGNASAISVVQGQVNDPTSNASALYTFVQTAQSTADGNTSAISALDARVENNEDFASAQLVLNSGYDSDLGTLTARAFLGVDVNNRVTGINIFGEPDNGVIQFIGDKIQFIRPNDLSVAFEWDAGINEFVFDGKIIAVDSTFTGTITGSTINGGLITGSRGLFTDGLAADFNGAYLEIGVDVGGTTFTAAEIGAGNNYINFTSSGITIVGPSFGGVLSVECKQVVFTHSGGEARTVQFEIPIFGSDKLSSSTSGQWVNIRDNVIIGGDLEVTGVFTNFTGAHPATKTSEYEWDAGDIVVDKDIESESINNCVLTASISNSINQKNCLGVWNGRTEEGRHLINAVGEGMINVCGQNGDIEQGDLITTSDMPGKGMRQDDDLVRNYTVAKSRQIVTFNSPDEVKQVACIYMCG